MYFLWVLPELDEVVSLICSSCKYIANLEFCSINIQKPLIGYMKAKKGHDPC